MAGSCSFYEKIEHYYNAVNSIDPEVESGIMASLRGDNYAENNNREDSFAARTGRNFV